MGERKAYWFYYADTPGAEPIIRIKNKRQPSAATIPCGGAWGLQEMYEGKWQMPCFPQITWGRLKQMHLVRKEPEFSDSIVRMARAIATLYGDPDEIASTSEKPLWKLYIDDAKVVLAAYEQPSTRDTGNAND